MQLRIGRRLTAGVMAGALTCALAAPQSAEASNGTYTQIICANPDTNQGVVPTDNTLPAGMVLHSDRADMARSAEYASCGPGAMSIWRGVLVSTMASFTTNVPDAGAYISYRPPTDIGFRGATLYRTDWLPPSNWGTSITGAEHGALFGSPVIDSCEWYRGCTGRGGSTPWADANRVDVVGGPGFNITLKCNIAGPTHSCSSNGQQFIEMYGAKASLEDATNPRGDGAPSGSLVEDAVLQGTESVTLNATDAGSGVYRAVVLVNGVARSSQVLDANNGRCGDVNPANGDDYEFAYGRPCKLAAGGSVDVDTTRLPEGTATVAVAVEDAGGNRTIVRSRTATVDNVPPPSVLEAPLVAGVARRGSGLIALSGQWDDHGVDGDPEISHRWQRCDRDGSNCADIDGATGPAYELTADDVGRRVRVVERATNREGAGQAASSLTAVVTLPDGTLPPDRDGIDNDGDGTVDEPNEQGATTDEASGAGNTRPPTESGSSSSVTSPGGSASSSSSDAGRVNGEGASPRARLSVSFARRSGSTLTVPHGRRVTITGRLMDEHGRPVRHAVVEPTEAVALRGGAARPGQPAITRSDGGFTYTVAAGASRRLRFAYRYRKDGSVVSEAGLRLKVRGGVRLAATLRGTAVTYRGTVISRPLPRGRKLVIVQGRAAGGRWQTFASRRTNKAGVFSGRYRLKIRRPGARLKFRARAVAEAGWPYLAGTSRAVTRKVR